MGTTKSRKVQTIYRISNWGYIEEVETKIKELHLILFFDITEDTNTIVGKRPYFFNTKEELNQFKEIHRKYFDRLKNQGYSIIEKTIQVAY